VHLKTVLFLNPVLTTFKTFKIQDVFCSISEILGIYT